MNHEPRKGALFVLTGGAFLFSMQQSLVVPALSTLQRDLQTTATMVTWLVTSLLVASAVATPIVGRLGDLFGRSRMLVLSLALLCAGTLLCALASSIEILLVGRVVQGLAGGVTSLTFSVVPDVMPPSRVANGVGLIAAMMSIGAATGIVFSGPIATALGYRWLFWLPLMAMVPIAIGTAAVVPASSGMPGVAVDWRGAVLLSLWLTALLVAVSQGPTRGWASTEVVTLAVVAVAGFWTWIAVERRTVDALVDIDLLRRPVLWRTNVGTFAVGMVMQSTFTFVPQLVQAPESTGYGLGIRPSRAGLVTLLWSIGSTVAGFVSGRLVVRRNHRSVMMAGATLAVTAYVFVVFFHATFVALFFELGIFGFGVGLFTAVVPMILMHQVAEHETGVTTALNQVVRTVGGAVGTQVVATILASNLRGDGFPRASMYNASFVVIAGACSMMLFAASALPRQVSISGPVAQPQR